MTAHLQASEPGHDPVQGEGQGGLRAAAALQGEARHQYGAGSEAAPGKAAVLWSSPPAVFQWALGSDKKVPAASKVEQERLREAIKNKEEERRRKRREERLEREEGEMKLKDSFSQHDDR